MVDAARLHNLAFCLSNDGIESWCWVLMSEMIKSLRSSSVYVKIVNLPKSLVITWIERHSILVLEPTSELKAMGKDQAKCPTWGQAGHQRRGEMKHALLEADPWLPGLRSQVQMLRGSNGRWLLQSHMPRSEISCGPNRKRASPPKWLIILNVSEPIREAHY